MTARDPVPALLPILRPGVAVGRAVRTSIVAINVLDLLMSMAIWGATTTVRLAG